MTDAEGDGEGAGEGIHEGLELLRVGGANEERSDDVREVVESMNLVCAASPST